MIPRWRARPPRSSPRSARATRGRRHAADAATAVIAADAADATGAGIATADRPATEVAGFAIETRSAPAPSCRARRASADDARAGRPDRDGGDALRPVRVARLLDRDWLEERD